MSELTKDTIINDRYVLLEHKGSGSFGEVWLAHDNVLDQQIALKIYISLDPRGVEEFKAEYNLAIGLSHPNLLTANYLDVWQHRPYLVMKYCANGSSGKLAGKIHEDTLIHFIHDVAAGLHYLHDRPDPIIHQDIKPDNILVDQDGLFLITDFGISKKIRSTMRKLSSRSIGAGATAYMGPERFEANPTPVKASDIWSLGASIYEMATGELPFSGMGGGMQRNGAAMPSLDDSWSPEVNQLMQACLAEETWDRPTAAQLEEYTADLLAGKKPKPTWGNEVQQEKSQEESKEESQDVTSESWDSISDSIVHDPNDPRNIDLNHYKQLKNITNTIYITFGCLLVLNGFLGWIGINKQMYTAETIYIGFTNCFILLLIALSAVKAIRRHQNNAIFKAKLFFGSTLFYWFCISIVATSLGLFKFVLAAICINGFRMISNSLEVEQLFPKSSRHFSLKDFLNLLVAILLPIIVEFTPYFLGSLMNDEGPQPVNTEVPQPQKKTSPKTNKKKGVAKENAKPIQSEQKLETTPQDHASDAQTDDAERLKIAIRKKDYQTIQRLANKGYAPSYVPLAKFYLEKNDYDDANRYAQKAKKAGQHGAKDIIQLLTNLGYFD